MSDFQNMSKFLQQVSIVVTSTCKNTRNIFFFWVKNIFKGQALKMCEKF
jgi:hypothetical protein